MILSDNDIHVRLMKGDLRIEGLYSLYNQVQPASVDLCVARHIICEGREHDLRDLKSWILQPGRFCLASTREKVSVPNDLVGIVYGKSSIGRQGVVVETAGYIDPGFTGTITLEIANLGTEPYPISVGQQICQIVFVRTKTPSVRPYGHFSRASKYQNQEGTTPARG